MSKSYEDYSYEDENDDKNQKSPLAKKILIIVLIVIAVFVILYLIKGCTGGGGETPVEPNTPTFNYEEALLKIINLGEDTDTIGAIAGGLAGLYYGYDNIPKEWKDCIVKKKWIENEMSQKTKKKRSKNTKHNKKKKENEMKYDL